MTKTSTDEYKIWCGIKRRCNYPNDISYKNYGAKGIKLCDRWSSFENFILSSSFQSVIGVYFLTIPVVFARRGFDMAN